MGRRGEQYRLDLGLEQSARSVPAKGLEIQASESENAVNENRQSWESGAFLSGNDVHYTHHECSVPIDRHWCW
ncbi:unnamed protein product, partial [Nesidiocoris tenuis]